MTPETEARLNAIRERAEKATPGPWKSQRYGTEVFAEIWSEYDSLEPKCVAKVWSPEELRTLYDRDKKSDIPERLATEQFIAQSRADIPFLLDTVIAELRARIRELEADFGCNLARERDEAQKRVAGLETILSKIGHASGCRPKPARWVPVDPGTSPFHPRPGTDPGTSPFHPRPGTDPGTSPFHPRPGTDPGTSPFHPRPGTDPGTSPFHPRPGTDPGTSPFHPRPCDCFKSADPLKIGQAVLRVLELSDTPNFQHGEQTIEEEQELRDAIEALQALVKGAK